jgi:hypothetical protein
MVAYDYSVCRSSRPSGWSDHFAQSANEQGRRHVSCPRIEGRVLTGVSAGLPEGVEERLNKEDSQWRVSGK